MCTFVQVTSQPGAALAEWKVTRFAKAAAPPYERPTLPLNGGSSRSRRKGQGGEQSIFEEFHCEIDVEGAGGLLIRGATSASMAFMAFVGD